MSQEVKSEPLRQVAFKAKRRTAVLASDSKDGDISIKAFSFPAFCAPTARIRNEQKTSLLISTTNTDVQAHLASFLCLASLGALSWTCREGEKVVCEYFEHMRELKIEGRVQCGSVLYLARSMLLVKSSCTNLTSIEVNNCYLGHEQVD